MAGINKVLFGSLLNDSFSGCQEIFEQVIQIFLNESPQSIVKIDKALAQKDFKELAFWSHKLKSSGRALGAEDFADICQKIEFQSKGEEFEGLEFLVEKLKKELETCHRDLQEIDFEKLQAS